MTGCLQESEIFSLMVSRKMVRSAAISCYIKLLAISGAGFFALLCSNSRFRVGKPSF